MTKELREFAFSSNGDRWFLESEAATGHRLIVHQANLPSGGQQTRFEIADFLRIDQGSPQHAALLELIRSDDHGSSDVVADSLAKSR